MTTPEVITTIKDILLGAAAVTTAIVAVIGLKNWSRELRGRTEFEAARKLMRATYRVRDELQYSRAPFVTFGEYPSDYPGRQTATTEQEAQAWSYVYRNRWKPVREALQELQTHVLEAEALWGGDIRTKADELRRCAITLQTAMEAIVDDAAQGGESFKTNRDFGKEMRSAAHASRGKEENELSKKIKAAVNALEDQVRPHLRRS